MGVLILTMARFQIRANRRCAGKLRTIAGMCGSSGMTGIAVIAQRNADQLTELADSLERRVAHLSGKPRS